MTGNEGVTDIFLLLGSDSTPATVIVQNPGYGYRIEANIEKRNLSGSTLQQVLLRFSQALLLKPSSLLVESLPKPLSKNCAGFS